ncbi:MAG: HAD hydrolase-like protein [Francisellaceae bacterium]|nr:HAD hydrolase-like protein [Francisellaceae bacterium]
MQKYIVFDFDGVLADSFDVFLDSLIEVQPLYFEKKSKPELIDISRNIGLNTLDVEKETFIRFTKDLRDCYIAREKKIKLFGFTEKILSQISDKNIKMGIVSSNDIKLINTILKRYAVADMFEFVVGDIALNGKDKTLSRLNDIGVNLERSWYVGDTPHDIKSAKFAEMQSAAACWGYSSKSLLEKESPKICLTENMQILTLI